MKILSLRQLPILCRLFFRRIAHDQIATAQDRQEIWYEIIEMLGTVDRRS